MDKDYRLGQDFSECIQKIRPDTQQKLLAILNDFAGSDHEIISAFRLLFGDPLYISLFLERPPINLAQVTSLTSIAQSSLSPSLAKRAETFVRGYFGIASCQSSSPASSPPPSSPQQSTGPSAFQQDTNSYESTASEESTIFADDEACKEGSNTHAPQEGYAGASPRFVKNTNLKPLLFAVLMGILGVAIFKVPAICEPFGLCTKREDSGAKDSKGLRSGDIENKSDSSDQPRPNAPQPPPEALSPPSRAPQPQSEGLAPPPAPKAPAPAPPIATPKPAYTPAPQAESAPLRDEPLW